MMTCSAVFFVSFPKYPKLDSKSGEDVSPIIEPELFVQKSAVKTDTQEPMSVIFENRLTVVNF